MKHSPRTIWHPSPFQSTSPIVCFWVMETFLPSTVKDSSSALSWHCRHLPCTESNCSMYAAVLAPPLISLTCTISRSGYLQTERTRKSIRGKRHSGYNKQNQMTSRTISFTPIPYAAEGQTPYTSEAIDANLDRHVVFSSLNCLRCHIKTNFLLSRTYVHLVHHIPSLYLHPVIYIFVLFVLLFFSFWKDLC